MITRTLKRRDRGPDVWLLHRRLMALGYLPGGEVTAFVRVRPVVDDVFDESTELALRVFQARHGLERTGVFDPGTCARLAARSCGGHDTGHGGLGYSVSGRWSSRNTALTWFSDPPALKGIDAVTVRRVLAECFEVWQKVAPSTWPVKFSVAATRADANVQISYADLTEDGGFGTDKLGECGHVNESSTQVQVKFDIKNTWDEALFRAVVMHELGHALGLGHSTVAHATMFPIMLPGQETLDPDDVNGFAAAYGSSAVSGVLISNPSPINCSWFAYNADDPNRGFALGSGDLLSDHSYVYDPPASAGDLLVRFTYKGGGTLLAAGTARKGKGLSLQTDGLIFYAQRN